MKARVVAFTNLFPRPWEPQRATFNRQQLERLAQCYDLEVLVPVSWLDWLKARRQGQDTRSRVSSAATRYFNYFYIPKLFRWSYGGTLLLSMLSVLPRMLGQNRPNIIYTPWAYPDGFATVVIGRLLGIPVVVKVLGSDINDFTTIPGVKAQIVWTLKNAAAVVAVSQDLAGKVIALGASPANTEVIYDGVDPARFKPLNQQHCREQLALDAQAKIIVYVGNLLPTKGCLDLIDSFAQLKQQMPDALLVYVGKGDICAAKMAARADSLGVKAAVRLVGTQPHEIVASWMGAADVVVLPSYNEGVPNVLLEAMACGKPIVATHVGGIPEVVPNFAGILVAPGDIAVIAEALKTAISATWDADKIITHVSQFTWERNIAELQAVLDSKANLGEVR
ncbi:MAG: glycosyltransferase family 4 protein [Methylococcaceae bacterium]|nr:glycosyltransferase family 4 protein [Methylococcaceae bacterium]